MNKKCGILTFQRALNYGAILQTYALQETIKSLQIPVEVIDYDSGYFFQVYQLDYSLFKQRSTESFFVCLYHWITHFKEMAKEQKKSHKILHFIEKNLNLSKRYTKANISNANLIYSNFICGSDQIWNMALSNYDINYYLDFVRPCNKRISYAASLGKEYFTGFELENMGKELPKFDFLSVREKSAQEILKKWCFLDSSLVLDPTLLQDETFWRNIGNKSRIRIHRKYILVYIIQESPEVIGFANNLSKETNLPIISLTPCKQLNHAKDFSDCGIEDFLSLIDNAKYVITTSYHGLLFSINFQKQFYFGLSHHVPNNNARLSDLCQSLGIENRRITEGASKSEQTIDWAVVEEKLSSLKAESINYLKNALQTEK
jgi:hypothetical protein